MNTDNLGERLREIRKEKGFTLVELGKLAHVSHAYISKIENGLTIPNYKMIENIAKILDPTGEEEIENYLNALAGHSYKMDENSAVYKQLRKDGRITDGFKQKMTVEDKPINKLNFILENDSKVIYDLKIEKHEKAIATIILPNSLVNKIYDTINKIVLEEVTNYPYLLESIENHEVLDRYYKEKDKKYRTIEKEIKELTFEKIIKNIDNDSELLF